MFAVIFFNIFAFIGMLVTSLAILVGSRIIANAIRPSTRPLG